MTKMQDVTNECRNDIITPQINDTIRINSSKVKESRYMDRKNLVNQSIDYIIQHLDEDYISKNHFSRIFNEVEIRFAMCFPDVYDYVFLVCHSSAYGAMPGKLEL